MNDKGRNEEKGNETTNAATINVFCNDPCEDPDTCLLLKAGRAIVASPHFGSPDADVEIHDLKVIVVKILDAAGVGHPYDTLKALPISFEEAMEVALGNRPSVEPSSAILNLTSSEQEPEKCLDALIRVIQFSKDKNAAMMAAAAVFAKPKMFNMSDLPEIIMDMMNPLGIRKRPLEADENLHKADVNGHTITYRELEEPALPLVKAMVQSKIFESYLNMDETTVDMKDVLRSVRMAVLSRTVLPFDPIDIDKFSIPELMEIAKGTKSEPLYSPAQAAATLVGLYLKGDAGAEQAILEVIEQGCDESAVMMLVTHHLFEIYKRILPGFGTRVNTTETLSGVVAQLFGGSGANVVDLGDGILMVDPSGRMGVPNSLIAALKSHILRSRDEEHGTMVVDLGPREPESKERVELDGIGVTIVFPAYERAAVSITNAIMRSQFFRIERMPEMTIDSVLNAARKTINSNLSGLSRDTSISDLSGKSVDELLEIAKCDSADAVRATSELIQRGVKSPGVEVVLLDTVMYGQNEAAVMCAADYLIGMAGVEVMKAQQEMMMSS